MPQDIDRSSRGTAKHYKPDENDHLVECRCQAFERFKNTSHPETQ
jgi:hypothetical protein